MLTECLTLYEVAPFLLQPSSNFHLFFIRFSSNFHPAFIQFSSNRAPTALYPCSDASPIPLRSLSDSRVRERIEKEWREGGEGLDYDWSRIG